MANKPQPIKTLRAGRIQAAIWENHSDKGPFYNVTVSRSYKEGDIWKSSDSFGRDDLLVLAQLLGSAYLSSAKSRPRIDSVFAARPSRPGGSFPCPFKKELLHKQQLGWTVNSRESRLHDHQI